MPQSKITIGLVLLMMTIGLLPFALIARSRAVHSPNAAVHLVFDMDHQPRYDPQAASPVFADGRAMRPHVEGTIAQEDLSVPAEILNDPTDPHLIDDGQSIKLTDASVFANVTLGRIRTAGMTDAQFDALMPPNTDAAVATDTTFYVRTVPPQLRVTTDFIHRGEERFNIYCAPCHGQSGYGDGMVHQRVVAIQNGPESGAVPAWVQPQNLHEAKILARPDGSIFNTITNGVRTMPAYDKQISIADRWAIVSYVRALERSQAPHPTDLAAADSPKAAQ
jgi:mono/diheme cytochrome c family protein